MSRKAQARCILLAYAARLSSGSRSTGVPLIQRRWKRWSANKKGDPTMLETNGYILRRRQRGESLEKTLGYVSSIMATGFKPDVQTLLSLMATDLWPAAQIGDLATKLRVDLKSTKSKGAWRVVFRNIILDRHGSDKSLALDFAMQQYDALVAAGYPVPRDALIALLQQASLSDTQKAHEITAWLQEGEFNYSRDVSPWTTTLMAAHLNVTFSNRAALFRRGIIDLDSQRLHVDPIVHECIKTTWLSENHSDAALAIFKLCGPGSTADTFMAAWKVLWHTRYRQSYVPTPTVLREGHDFALKKYRLTQPVLTTAAIGYAAAANKLRTQRPDREVLGTAHTQAVFDGAVGLASSIDTMLSSGGDSVSTRGALVELVAQTDNHAALLHCWSSYCQTSPGLDHDVLNIALSACTRGQGLSTAREVLRVCRKNWVDFNPDTRNWAVFVECLAAGNALQPALRCARDRLQGHGDLWRTLFPILDCAYRMDELRPTMTFLKEELNELYRHPRVLSRAAELHKRSKASVRSVQRSPTKTPVSWSRLATQSKPTVCPATRAASPAPAYGLVPG